MAAIERAEKVDRIGQVARLRWAGRTDQAQAIGMLDGAFGPDPRHVQLGSGHCRPVDCLIECHSRFLLSRTSIERGTWDKLVTG
jgi:hypothetical protein